jgi:hypothetical protein
MKTISRVFMPVTLVAALLFSTSCLDCIEGDGNVIQKTVEVGNFTKIKLNGDANITLTSDSAALFLIKGEKNILDEYKVEVEGKTLVIASRHCLRNHEQVSLQIPYKQLESVIVNGSGSVYANEAVKSASLELKINGSGDFEVPLDVQDLSGTISGSGDIVLTGTAKNADFTINGSGNIDTPELSTEQCSVTVNGSGDCTVWASGNLKVDIRGSGSVYYKGNPSIKTDIKGSGSVNKKE